jgi:hypothetical protein
MATAEQIPASGFAMTRGFRFMQADDAVHDALPMLCWSNDVL